MKKRHLWLLFPLTIVAQTLFAQNSGPSVPLNPKILSSSGFETSGSGSISFSVGFLNNEIILDEESGSTTDSLPEATVNEPKAAPNMAVYPNPFIDRITLSIENFTYDSEENYDFELLDISGSTLQGGAIENEAEEILLNTVPKGIYFLLLYKNGEKLKSFKLIPSDL